MRGLSGYSKRGILGNFWQATSPADFWSKWNPGVHNGFVMFLKGWARLFGKKAIFLAVPFIFLVNGLFHDIIIVRIISGNDGFPFTMFFSLNLIVVLIERGIRKITRTKLLLPIPNIFKTLLTFVLLVILWKISMFIAN
ncbi:MAG: hypothetical protein A3G49_02815 [Candidatus Sungbacteria bacterium RIFCSPLOWO2_12_FULL_41_11]|uniref:Uncharacterized protein n=1 Tax=Candidatus Sungbacteria bacterium RIFCSPLOWO2_12_FULL_41_11 TaxID=1802286 RepID=A0A1G2LR78_9BACT|nr:MAG: hypothetical protein UV01_C0001G0071 [Parcubacteria group bacterium GW2011_GWA2_42_14]OHA14148.1 MAG: hypothetical protein A3G49_02815 [Candidatus Sungbacteria bacterium RIFCSPLOWO2_12_FULL_41_11]